MNFMGISSFVGTFLFRSCLEIVKKCIDVYLYFTNKSDNMIQDHSINLGDYKIEKYNIIKNNKNYKIIFSSKCSNELQKQILDCKINMTLGLSNKNMIVNCSITDETGKNSLDITENIRNFSYYFDKDVNVDIFLQHLKFQDCIDYNNYSHLSLYMNDFDFTEKTYDLKTLQTLKFSEIFLN